MSEEQTYIVRLLFEVPATRHEDAVGKIVDQLSRHGIINWVYRSQRYVDGDIKHLNGDLEEVDMEDVIRQLEEDGKTEHGTPQEQAERAKQQQEQGQTNAEATTEATEDDDDQE